MGQVMRTERELEEARAAVQLLELRLAAEEAAKATATRAMRGLAVRLHRALCRLDHAALECTWYTVADADDAEAADWTEERHAWWLEVARVGVGLQAELGWTVVEPAEAA